LILRKRSSNWELRITGVPIGEAPLWVREAWTGLALPLYDPRKRVVGIDLSSDMLARAKQRVVTQRLRNIVGLAEIDPESMAFADDSFDIAVAMFTATVVPDARRLMGEMRRVVRPGGQLLFVNHFAAQGGLRWWAERTLAPLSRVLGWHPDFTLGDLLDDPRMATEIVPCPPFGLFTLVRVPQLDVTVPQPKTETAFAGATSIGGGRPDAADRRFGDLAISRFSSEDAVKLSGLAIHRPLGQTVKERRRALDELESQD